MYTQLIDIIYEYNILTNRKQCVQLNKFVSDWLSIPSGVPQGSHILSSLLFNILINDIFDLNLQSLHT